MPGVDTNPLYLDWLGLAKGKPIPAELPRRAAAAWDGVLRFRIMLQAVMRNKTDFQKSDSTQNHPKTSHYLFQTFEF